MIFVPNAFYLYIACQYDFILTQRRSATGEKKH